MSISLKRFFRLTFSIILICLLIWMVEPFKLLGILSDAPLSKLIPWILFYEIAVVSLWVVGIKGLLQRQHQLSFFSLLSYGMKLQVFSLVIPGRLGDFSLPYMLRHIMTIRDSTLILIVDKLISLVVMAGIGCLALIYFLPWPEAKSLLGIIVAILIVLVILTSNQAQTIRNKVIVKLLGQYAKHTHGVRRQLINIFKDWHNVSTNLFMTLARTLLAGISLQLILGWFGTEVVIPLWYIIIVQAVAQLAILLPISFMGIGVVESINIMLIGAIGVDNATILAASLAARAVQICFFLLLFIVLFRDQIALKKG